MQVVQIQDNVIFMEYLAQQSFKLAEPLLLIMPDIDYLYLHPCTIHKLNETSNKSHKSTGSFGSRNIIFVLLQFESSVAGQVTFSCQIWSYRHKI